jgi:hypothetical protein
MNIRRAATTVGPVSSLNFTYYANYLKIGHDRVIIQKGVFYFSLYKYNSKTTRAIKTLRRSFNSILSADLIHFGAVAWSHLIIIVLSQPRLH